MNSPAGSQQMRKNSHVARNLLSTTGHSFTGPVSSTSRLPVRFSSDSSRMVRAGTGRTTHRIGIRSNRYAPTIGSGSAPLDRATSDSSS